MRRWPDEAALPPDRRLHGSPVRGNQLAVVLEAEGLSSELMQTIAREFNLSETTS
jgi:hypothetical protein